MSLLGGLVMLAFAWPSACVVNEVGSVWEWNLAMSAGVDPSADVVVGDRTLSATLDRALVSIVSLEAIPCGSASSMTRLTHWSLLNVARAHGPTTPTRMATPHVIDLLAPEASPWASTLSHPPPDSYCWVRVTIGPADRDAVGMPSDEDLTDAALIIRGRYAADAGKPDTSFTVSSTRTQSIDVALVDRLGQVTPLVVSRTNRNMAVDVWLESPAVLDGVDPSSSATAQGGLYAITNLLASVHAMGCDTAPCVER